MSPFWGGVIGYFLGFFAHCLLSWYGNFSEREDLYEKGYQEGVAKERERGEHGAE